MPAQGEEGPPVIIIGIKDGFIKPETQDVAGLDGGRHRLQEAPAQVTEKRGVNRRTRRNHGKPPEATEGELEGTPGLCPELISHRPCPQAPSMTIEGDKNTHTVI